ncbi:MAG TPA: RimK/LysX family protein [Gammaproteobacteria bacterium]|nr:RimK/LysX family protein [Gammaproteobacteria bacterium]
MTRKLVKQIIGWREWVAFPDLGIEKIKAKIDTGARSSALHAYDIQVYKTKTGKVRAKFFVHPLQKNSKCSIPCHADVIDQRYVKSSSGQKELRTTILTNLLLGAQTWPIEITLTNRDSMGFRLLIGRTALRRKFLVDPQRSFFFGI